MDKKNDSTCANCGGTGRNPGSEYLDCTRCDVASNIIAGVAIDFEAMRQKATYGGDSCVLALINFAKRQQAELAAVRAAASAPKAELTDEQILEMDCLRLTHSDDDTEHDIASSSVIEFARAIERAVLAQAAPVADERPGLERAAKYLERQADEYLSEHARTEDDTGATVFQFGEAGQDYYNTLTELADELRNLAPAAAPVIAQAAPGEPVALLNDEEMAALRRFNETCEDDEEYDVPKAMMRRLTSIGVVEWKGFSRYQMTDFGLLVLDQYIAPVAAQQAGASDATQRHVDWLTQWPLAAQKDEAGQ